MLAIKLHMLGMFIVLTFTVVSAFVVMLGKFHPAMKGWAIVSILFALFLFVQRDTYLPFLGHAAVPASLLKEASIPDGANVSVQIPVDAPDGTKLIYWGAKPSDVVYPTPWDAYDSFTNAGVTLVKNGAVTIRFHCPSKYRIPSGRTLNRHVHYRVAGENGMVGPVQTKYVNC